MNKATGVAIATAAVGTAAAVAYSSMKPQAKKVLKKEFRETMNHMDDVKENLCDVRKGVSEVAKTLKEQI